MKLKKVLFGVAIVVVVVILAALVGVHYAEKHYSNRVIPVKDKVAITIAGIDLSLLKGGVVLRDIQLLDTLDPVATGNVDYVTIQGFHLLKLITGGGFSISSLKVEGIHCALNLSRLKKDTISVVPIDSLDLSLSTDTLDKAEEVDTVQAMLYFSASRVGVFFDEEMHPDFKAVDIDHVEFRPGKREL